MLPDETWRCSTCGDINPCYIVACDGGESDSPQVGWICPRCGTSLAPWVYKCNCKAEKGDVVVEL